LQHDIIHLVSYCCRGDIYDFAYVRSAQCIGTHFQQVGTSLLVYIIIVLSTSQVRRDGTKMSLSQSKKLSQLTADNAQWEDRQLLRSGAVRGTEVQTEFDDEDERKVILLVHGKY
jgi:hypothetical protein